MSKSLVQATIEINAPVSKVWRVFADPVLTRQMGGEYVSDWEVGAPFGWKGPDGKMVTSGTIRNIAPAKLLQHDLLNAVGTVGSVITYEFGETDQGTRLSAREEFAKPITDAEYTDAVEGWNAALRAVKEIAEK